MGVATEKFENKGVSNVANKPNGSASSVKRNRKKYDHEMTEPEKFALQTVQRATGALRTINDAIKSGRKVKPEIVSLCFDLSKAVGDMLFQQD